jgi:hypothetical protein
MNPMHRLFATIKDKRISVAGKKLYAYGEDRFNRIFSTASYQIVEGLSIFAPFSWGPWRARAKLTLLAANQTFPLLTRLLGDTRKAGVLAARPIESFCVDDDAKQAASALRALFDKYGSDKSRTHHYELLYGSILRDPASIGSILEIGLGTNNLDVVSHMGADGKPGASLRAFRDFLPKAAIYGADVDSTILFQEERIKTFFVDQTDLSSFDALGKAVGEGLDLIIDDGLHCPNANLAVLLFSLKQLKRGGWLVVEDIPDHALPVWQVVAALMPSDCKCHLASASEANLFFLQRL